MISGIKPVTETEISISGVTVGWPVRISDSLYVMMMCVVDSATEARVGIVTRESRQRLYAAQHQCTSLCVITDD